MYYFELTVLIGDGLAKYCIGIDLGSPQVQRACDEYNVIPEDLVSFYRESGSRAVFTDLLQLQNPMAGAVVDVQPIDGYVQFTGGPP